MNHFPEGLDRVLQMAENCPPIKLVVADRYLLPDQIRVLSPVAITQRLTFDDDFHLGDERTGAGCLIWANALLTKRVRFFISQTTLVDILGRERALAGEVAIASCRRERSRIEAACQRALGERPLDRIELQARDFR
jgi:hypothetical protein